MVFGLCSCTSTDSANNSDATTTSTVEDVTENNEETFEEFWSNRDFFREASSTEFPQSDLMNVTADSLFLIYLPLSDKCTSEDFYGLAFFPDHIPMNVTFSDAQLAYAESLSEAVTNEN